jgi:hypothetical protein
MNTLLLRWLRLMRCWLKGVFDNLFLASESIDISSQRECQERLIILNGYIIFDIKGSLIIVGSLGDAGRKSRHSGGGRNPCAWKQA